jgi:hypothetical protein
MLKRGQRSPLSEMVGYVPENIRKWLKIKAGYFLAKGDSPKTFVKYYSHVKPNIT